MKRGWTTAPEYGPELHQDIAARQSYGASLIVPDVLEEIAAQPDFHSGGLAEGWRKIKDDVRRLPQIEALRRRRTVAFFGVSFEQARQAAAMAAHTDCVPVLIHVRGDQVAGHYARAFPATISVERDWQMFPAALALAPLAATMTLPSKPFYYRTLLPLLHGLEGLNAIPFVYDFPPPPSARMSMIHRFSCQLLEGLPGFYSWHEPMLETHGGYWSPIATFFNQPSGERRPRSLVYAGSLPDRTAEANLIFGARDFAAQGYTVDFFDARRTDAGPPPPALQGIEGVSYHARVPEFQLLRQLSEYEYGLHAPFPYDGRRPPFGTDGDWCNRHGVPGKLAMYLEAGVIPIVHVETEYAARFIETYDIGHVFTDDDYFDMDRALARKPAERLRANLLRLREKELNWKTHVGRLTDYFAAPPGRVSLYRPDRAQGARV